jgi:hypothetical protein
MRPPQTGVFGGVQKTPVRSGWDRSGPGDLTCEKNVPVSSNMEQRRCFACRRAVHGHVFLAIAHSEKKCFHIGVS